MLVHLVFLGWNEGLKKRYNMKMLTLPKMMYTLCFLLRGNEVLMLHRNNPPNQGLWNGVGGKIEPNETSLEGCLREVWEETGYALQEVHFAGILTWEGYEIPTGGLYLYTAQAPEMEARGNGEGELAWKPREWVYSAEEVVSNIHIFAPIIFNGVTALEMRAQIFHFVYRDGKIERYEIRPYVAEEELDGSTVDDKEKR